MARVFISIILFFITQEVSAQEKSDFRLFLVGDAGEDELIGETLDSLKSNLLANPNSAVIYLGDNSYRNNLWVLPGYKGFDSSRVTQNKVRSQLNTLDGYKGYVYFIPGNHDWWNTGNFSKGKKKLKMEESFIEANLEKNSTIKNPDSTCFLPSDGNPGPASVELNNGKLRIVFIDTEWFLLMGFKKTPEENETLARIFYHNIDSVLADAKNKGQQIIVAGHHPMIAYGPYNKKLKSPNLFKRIKSSYMTSPGYSSLIKQLNPIFEKYPGMYYVSGHVHGLQYLSNKGVNYIVSGSGSKTIHVEDKDATGEKLCDKVVGIVWNEKGFFEIDFSHDTSKVIMYHDNGRKREVF
jgi:hypothetical protein